jgi:NaMN:DMB phosphoribosyltransferase
MERTNKLILAGLVASAAAWCVLAALQALAGVAQIATSSSARRIR